MNRSMEFSREFTLAPGVETTAVGETAEVVRGGEHLGIDPPFPRHGGGIFAERQPATHQSLTTAPLHAAMAPTSTSFWRRMVEVAAR